MSLLSTFALLVTAGLKLKPNREAELAADIVGLKIDLADARRDRDDWQARADAWRERALANIPAAIAAPQPAGPDFRPPELARAQLQQWAQSQQQVNALQHQQYAQAGLAQQGQMQAQALQNAQIAQQHQLAGQGLMLGAQAINPDLWCNCVPSRAQVWAANGADEA